MLTCHLVGAAWPIESKGHLGCLGSLQPQLDPLGPCNVLLVLSVPIQGKTDIFRERALTTHEHGGFISGKQQCVMHAWDVGEPKTYVDNVERLAG